MLKIANDDVTKMYVGTSAVTKAFLRYDQVWPNTHDYNRDYFTVNVLSAGTISFSQGLDYSTDNGQTWTTLSANQSLSTSAGDKVLYKGSITANTAGGGAGRWNFNATVEIAGNPMSLFNPNKVSFPFKSQTVDANGTGYQMMMQMFAYNSRLVSAENLVLPATTLTTGCYRSMFSGCTSLTTAPALPATTLANSCYEEMFKGCTSLTTTPTLPATTLGEKSYAFMFSGCTSLTSTTASIGDSGTTVSPSACTSMYSDCTSLIAAPELPARTISGTCYQNMFNNCTSLTTVPSELPATKIPENGYRNMFNLCSGITSVPVLSATSGGNYCCRSMFNGCTSLTTVTLTMPNNAAQYAYYGMFSNCSGLTTANITLPATSVGVYSHQGMFSGCINLTTAPALPARTLSSNCYRSMFNGCTSLTTAPVLSAATLTDYCYYGMFNGCESLNWIKMTAANVSASNAITNWVGGVAATGHFIKAQGVSIPTGVNGIPDGWTVEADVEVAGLEDL